MSKRSDRRRDRPPREADGTSASAGTSAKRHDGSPPQPTTSAGAGAAKARRSAASGASAAASTGESSASWSLGLQLAFLVAVFAVVTLIAELAGAANLGVALGAGQVAFALAVIYLLVRR